MEITNKELKRLLKSDVVEYGQGPQELASNLVGTPKSNSRIRLCLDAREVNSYIQRETYPIQI